MQSYVIRRAFLIPLGLVIALCLTLGGVVIFQHQPGAKLLVLAVVILPLLFVFVECAFRRIELDETGIRAFRLGRLRTILWSEITALETVRVRQRAFLTICAGEEFIIVSNMYSGFPQLTQKVLELTPASAISEETRQMALAPPMKHSDIVILWLLTGMMAWLVSVQFTH